MSIQVNNRVLTVFTVVLLLLLGALGWVSWSYFRLHLEAANAEWQTQVFDEVRAKALQSDAAEAASCLQYVIVCYPSGSKQRTGSHLDLVVERHRKEVLHNIIQYLHQKTGEDLGDKPEPWIQKYDKKQ